jgi:hypothetical protein
MCAWMKPDPVARRCSRFAHACVDETNSEGLLSFARECADETKLRAATSGASFAHVCVDETSVG